MQVKQECLIACLFSAHPTAVELFISHFMYFFIRISCSPHSSLLLFSYQSMHYHRYTIHMHQANCETRHLQVERAPIEVNRRRTYSCAKCSMNFRSKLLLRKHLRTHSGERPFLCPHCPHQANRRDNMRTHCLLMHGLEIRRLVRGTKPYD